MFKVNILIGFLSLVAGIGNILIGYDQEYYSSADAALASTQVILAAAVVVTGVSRAKWLFSYGWLSRHHVLAAIIFYVFIFSGLVFVL